MLLFQCPDADTSVPFAGLRLFPLTPNLKESNDVFRACVSSLWKNEAISRDASINLYAVAGSIM